MVVGDSAAGVGADVLAFAALADRVVLIVSTPDLAALTDAYGLIKALDQHGVRHGVDIPTPEVLVNHASGVEEGRAVARKLRSICERFLARSPRQAGWLPRGLGRAQSSEALPSSCGPAGPWRTSAWPRSRAACARLAGVPGTPVAAGKTAKGHLHGSR